MYVDFKITTWERIIIPSEAENEVQKLIKTGMITTGSDLADYLNGCDTIILTESEEYMTPVDNDNCSTIELYDEEGVLLYDNSIK